MNIRKSLKKDVLSVGGANAIDYLLKFLIPILVVRSISEEDFAGYRMVWLVVGTIMAFATLSVASSLPYFLPRLKDNERAKYVYAVVLLLTFFATLSSILVNPFYPLLPLEWVHINGPIWFYSVFIFLWIIASLIETLPVADRRISWQTHIIITLSLVRIISVSTAAWFIGTLESILIVLTFFVLFKIVILVYYINRYHKVTDYKFPKETIKSVLKYSSYFGFSEGLFLMRQNFERWLVAALLSTKDFASFSLGSIASPLFWLIRKSINNVVFPNLSMLEAKNEKTVLAELVKKATSSVAFALIPLAIFLGIYATEIINIFYTTTYTDAANVMRIYLLGVIPMMFESSLLLRLTGSGRIALNIEFFMLPLVITVSYFGIQFMGLAGGALGSVVAVFITQYIAAMKGAAKLKIRVTHLYDFRRLFWIITIAILSGLIGKFVTYSLDFEMEFLQVAVGGITIALCYVSITYVSKVMPKPILRLLKFSI